MAIPALPVIIELVWDEDYEENRWQVRCPHCGRVNAFRQVEVAVAWNVTEEFEVRDGSIVEVVWSRTNGSGDFEHDRYECEDCEKPVAMKINSEEWRH